MYSIAFNIRFDHSQYYRKLVCKFELYVLVAARLTLGDVLRLTIADKQVVTILLEILEKECKRETDIVQAKGTAKQKRRVATPFFGSVARLFICNAPSLI